MYGCASVCTDHSCGPVIRQLYTYARGLVDDKEEQKQKAGSRATTASAISTLTAANIQERESSARELSFDTGSVSRVATESPGGPAPQVPVQREMAVYKYTLQAEREHTQRPDLVHRSYSYTYKKLLLPFCVHFPLADPPPCAQKIAQPELRQAPAAERVLPASVALASSDGNDDGGVGLP